MPKTKVVSTLQWGFRIAATTAKDLLSGLVSVLYPPVCLGCSRRVAGAKEILCVQCLVSADRTELYEVEERLARLPEAREAIDFACSLWLFDKGGFLQHVHHALKYGNRPTYGNLLGEVLGTHLLDVFSERERPSLLIPVPLHRSRLYERGYNQSESLAEGVSSTMGLPVSARALARIRHTRSQTRLSRERRWANLVGAFGVTDVQQVAGRRILLIDDILTTGSTAGAAARCLKESGARAVDLATLAMARM